MTIIGVAGGTASGKTTLVNKVVSDLNAEQVGLIAQDAYYKDNSHLSFEQRCLLNYDHPDALDFDLMVSQIIALKNGTTIEQPIYDYSNHNRTQMTRQMCPKSILIIEGILVFHNAALRTLMDLKVFVDAPAELRLDRRMQRDIAERGRSQQEVITRYQNTLKPMHDQFIEPTKEHADIIVQTHKENPKAVSLLNSYIKSLINSVDG